LETSEPRAVLGAGGKQGDTAAWVAQEQVGDPLDVPRLFAAFVPNVKSSVAAHRIVTLARRRDARIVSGILRLLAAPPLPRWHRAPVLPRVRHGVGDLEGPARRRGLG
jgi:hypothetical protein